MGIFSPNYSKPGPGIPKDLPPKKGLDLFFDIVKREFWDLIKLNLLFILFSLPIITAGAAYAAMTKITTRMIWDKNVYVFHDFMEAFRKEFKRSFPTGIGVMVVYYLIFISARFYLQMSGENRFFLFIFFFLCLVTFIITLALVFLFPLLVNVDLPYKATIKNSFLLGIVCIKQSLPCLLVTFGLLAIIYLFLPLVFSMPLIFIFMAAFISLINSFAAWPGIKKFVLRDPSEETPDENDEETSLSE